MVAIVNLLALAATALAIPKQVVNNYCPYPKYLWLIINGTNEGEPYPKTVPSRQAYISTFNLTGNVLTVANETTKQFSDPAPRLQLGTSWSDNLVYWSDSYVVGPLPEVPFSINAIHGTATCTNTTAYDKEVRACPGPNVQIVVSLCTDLAPKGLALGVEDDLPEVEQ